VFRWLGTFECAIIGVLCLFFFGPFVVGLALRVLRSGEAE
jgi:hypothetical protein